jgi:hypothetical protein
MITTGNAGVVISGLSGTVSNQGRIQSGFATGVELEAGGTLVNFGTVQGASGVFVIGGSDYVSNVGNITGTGGVGLSLGGDGGTLVNSGTIAGGNGTAVAFSGTGGNLLVLKPGYAMTGGVVGSGSATNTLELAGGAIGRPLTVDYNGLTLTNFSNVLFGPSGYDTLKVSNTAGTLPVTISGFGLVSDIIDLTQIGTAGAITQNDTVNHRVTLSGAGGTVTLQLDASDAAAFATMSDGASGTELVACFGRGTLILTASGEVAVEDLAIGDRVVTASGALAPIKWLGHRAYDGRFIAGNRDVLPVRIAAGALGPGLPARDLWLSPEHALYLDGALVAACLLVNGTTIVHADSVERLEYFHIELVSHDVIIAEGVPTESYVECDNRGMFQNAAEFALLYPDDRASAGGFCAPRLAPDAAELAPIRAALSALTTAAKAA